MKRPLVALISIADLVIGLPFFCLGALFHGAARWFAAGWHSERRATDERNRYIQEQVRHMEEREGRDGW
jgi:hypothetical protein